MLNVTLRHLNIFRKSIAGQLIFPLILIGALALALAIHALQSIHQQEVATSSQIKSQLLVNTFTISLDNLTTLADLQILVSDLAMSRSVEEFNVIEPSTQLIIASSGRQYVWEQLSPHKQARFRHQTTENTSVNLTEKLHEQLYYHKSDITYISRITQKPVNYTLAIILNSNEIFDATGTKFTDLYVIVVSSIGAILLSMAFILYQLFIKPLRETTLMIRSGSQLIPQHLAEDRDDELGELGRSFNMVAMERALQQRQLEQARRYADGLTATTPVLMFYLDIQERFRFTNKRALEWSGLSADEMEGAKLVDILGPSSYAKLAPYVNQALKGEKVTFEGYIPSQEKSIFSIVTLIPDVREGAVLGLFASVEDMSESKAVEEQLKQAKEAAEQGAKAKSEFLATMSHEIRTPMNGVIGMMSLLARTPLNEDQAQKLDMARQSAKSLMKIINDILDFSKVDAGKLDIEVIEFDAIDIIETQIALMRPAIKDKHLFIETHFDRVEHRKVMGDPGRFQQVLNNLLANALKFTENGGITVTLETQGNPSNSDIIDLRCVIEDTGLGIDADKQSKLFEAFTQENASITRKYGGTGLGLAIVKNLCSLMGGTISVKSEKNRGSTFTFTLSLKRPAKPIESDDHTALAQEIDEPTGTHRILVAEDHKINQAVIDAFLIQHGCKPTIANNGLEAIELLKKDLETSNKNQQPFTLILMDCEMPELDGKSATKKIRAGEAGLDYKNIPIVALTAHAFKEEKEECLKAGMNDCITKPINNKALKSILSRFAAPAAHQKPEKSPSNVAAFNGSNKKYIGRLRQRFENNYANGTLPLVRLLDQKSHKEALHWTHDLKGLSSGLGFNKLKAVARDLEESLEKNPNDCLELISECDKLLRQAHKELAQNQS